MMQEEKTKHIPFSKSTSQTIFLSKGDVQPAIHVSAIEKAKSFKLEKWALFLSSRMWVRCSVQVKKNVILVWFSFSSFRSFTSCEITWCQS
ncbi:hypothetical protein GOP47_0015401 [Adiantum capillus-veneris]|uniref:Uncharacterized protein n=1 Tax=Adiantum capillus-veneris TaxID=13818 RepID=A0A9D4ZD60_ADICA|nr:hypothetical protein GOP47_0015401 [Adiantum capillus-veneris]